MDNLEKEVRRLKDELGNQLIVLCHHYQRNEVFQFADGTGDSLVLGKIGAGL